MAPDYSKQFQLLRDIYDRMQRKEAVDPSELTAAGVSGKRLKDVEKEISRVKKLVSLNKKTEVKEEEQRELEELAKQEGISVEEYLKREAEEKEKAKRDINLQRKKAEQMKLAEDRDKKVLGRETNQGDHDLQVDYV